MLSKVSVGNILYRVYLSADSSWFQIESEEDRTDDENMEDDTVDSENDRPVTQSRKKKRKAEEGRYIFHC